jgi:uncharacterized protein involved in exopolysaccharide biosynthesis
MSAERSNAFADLKLDLANEFKPKPASEKPVQTIDRKTIDKIADEHGFPSRRAGKGPAATKTPQRERQRRNATGRNQQINIKTTAEAIELLYEIADRKGVPLGKVFEDGLEALKKTGY